MASLNAAKPKRADDDDDRISDWYVRQAFVFNQKHSNEHDHNSSIFIIIPYFTVMPNPKCILEHESSTKNRGPQKSIRESSKLEESDDDSKKFEVHGDVWWLVVKNDY